MDAAERGRSLACLRQERDAALLYDGLAGIERDPARAAVFRTIAANERRHAFVWAARLRRAGAEVPDAGPPGWRVRGVLFVARLLGTQAVAGVVQGLEGDELARYEALEGPEMAAMAAEEREHADTWKRLELGAPGVDAAVAVAGSPADAAARRSRSEAAQRVGQSGTLRAAVFGINDGLVSNLALVMGVAGATADNRIIVLAGVAGLLAGAFSMAAGEYISMQSQRELFERQIEIERHALRLMPDVERQELAALYVAKGLSQGEADLVADRLMRDPEHALDTKIREQLGLDPSALGSPWGAATSSFLTFGLGAIIPLAPFLLSSGLAATAASVVLALASLFIVGALVSLLTGRGLLYSGLRQVFLGGAAALVTYTVGTLMGVQVA
jgi:VIT1/CCC1 family predicted Fe2+/Mn2+ transporter